MSKASDAGKSFLTGVLAKVPDALRAQVETALLDPTAEPALEILGSGALAQSDINRRYDEIKTKEDSLTEDYTRLNTWYADNKAKLEEYDTLKASRGNPDPPRDPTKPALDPDKYLDRDTFAKALQQEQMAAANYLALQNALTMQHYDRFKEVIDTRDLLADKRLGSPLPDGRVFGLKEAYEAKYAEKLTTYQQQQEDTRINKLVDERLTEERKKLPQQPFPLRQAPSALDLLEPGATEKPDDFTPDRAAAFYQDLVSKTA